MDTAVLKWDYLPGAERDTPPEGTSPGLPVQFSLNVFFSKVTPGTQTLSTHCIPYKPKPTGGQSGKMAGPHPDGKQYYAAINLVNYILTQAVGKQKHNHSIFSPLSLSAFLSLRK